MPAPRPSSTGYGYDSSHAAEAYRLLRTNLLFSPGRGRLRTLAVTSAVPLEGKTVTAANLAVAASREGLRVLLVDCDLRRGRLHEVFGVPRTPGLAELLAGKDLTTVIPPTTPPPGLSLISRGAARNDLSDPLQSSRMRELLRYYAAWFDVTILDTPPVLAVSDTAVIGALADAVLLVVRAGHTERGVVQEALRQLTTVGANVVGAVLNDPDGRASKSGGYAYAGAYDYVEACDPVRG
jgi:capsular exopolysaccharide synthesis family protein